MINMNFMPSRRLALYMVKLFLTRSIAVLIALTMVLMMLDLLGESSKILAVPGNGEAELWHYVSLRVPLLVSRFLPFSVLLGTLIAFTALNQHSEVIAMKAAGLSAHQILAPLIVAAAGVSILLFAFNETVAVKSARIVNAWSGNDYHPVPPESGVMSNVWLTAGDDLVHARTASGRGANFRLDNVTIYRRHQGALEQVIEIAEARPDPAGDWQFKNIETYDSGMSLLRTAEAGRGLDGIEPSRFTLAKVDPTSMNMLELGDAIEALDAVGRPSDAARAGWWHKITGPISTMLMPLLAAVAAFGLARSGQVLLRATLGMAMGFAYFVADNFSLAMGNVGAYPPWLAAWGPVMLFFLIGETVLIRTEE